MASRSAAQRSLDAETRAVEEGHVARVQSDGSVLVSSDTHPGKSYRVRFSALAAGEAITFECHPEGNRRYLGDHLALYGNAGETPCKHMALAARRLEREGLARWDRGWWVCTEKAAEVTASRLPPQPASPFDGLPS